jgi:hypothetical protein
MVSIRFTLSAVVAVTVAVVAAVTLSITLTTSLQAIRSIGTGHAAALLSTAAVKTTQMYEAPQTAMDALDNVTMRYAWEWPSNDPHVLDVFLNQAEGLFYANRRRFAYMSISFADNTQLTIAPTSFSDLSDAGGTYSVSVDIASPLNESATGTDGQTMLRREKHVFRYSDNSEMLPGDPDADPTALSVGSPSKPVGSALWDAIPLLTANGQKKSTMPTIPVRRKTTDVIEYIPFGGALYTHGSPRNMNYIYSAAMVSFYLDELTEFLAATRVTPNTIAVAMSDGYITATSDTLNPASTLTTVRKGTPAHRGCSSTETTDSASHTDAIIVCKRLATDDPNPAIAAAGSDPELAATESLAVKIIDVGSDV